MTQKKYTSLPLAGPNRQPYPAPCLDTTRGFSLYRKFTLNDPINQPWQADRTVDDVIYTDNTNEDTVYMVTCQMGRVFLRFERGTPGNTWRLPNWSNMIPRWNDIPANLTAYPRDAGYEFPFITLDDRALASNMAGNPFLTPGSDPTFSYYLPDGLCLREGESMIVVASKKRPIEVSFDPVTNTPIYEDVVPSISLKLAPSVKGVQQALADGPYNYAEVSVIPFLKV